MANILLTTQCNRSCPYCFAQREMSGSPRDNLLSWENLIYIADFLKASGERQVSLLGGEPTLHPECVDIILYLLERGFDVTVFTNGILSAARLEEFRRHLTDIPIERLTFTCNLNDPVQTPASHQEARKIQRFLFVMGPWTMPGFNIYRLDFTLDFLFDLINRFGMKRHLRLGVCHPVLGQRSGFIGPRDMGQVVERLYSYRRQFDALRVKPGLDCGFPLCQMPDEVLGWLHRFPGPVQFGCGPAVDISPDMSVYYCFPLARYKRKSLFEFDSLGQLEDHFQLLRHEIKAELPGIYDECDGCPHLENRVCEGGGLCHVLNRFMDEAPIRIPEIENELAQNRLSS
ncbi:MAG: radical SAM protein [Deltaproteobacteria bacterium]|nr:radical SAM protein [Deltaproteobacteria bacterium]